jgi:hypothetical protein
MLGQEFDRHRVTTHPWLHGQERPGWGVELPSALAAFTRVARRGRFRRDDDIDLGCELG